MVDIPLISFRPQFQVPGFELLDLQELVGRCGDQLDHDPFRPHRVGFYALLYLTDGGAIHEVDLHQHVLRAGDCLLIAMGQIHAFDPKGDYQGDLLLFTDAFLLHHLAGSTLDQISPLFNYHVENPHMAGGPIVSEWMARIRTEWQQQPQTGLEQILAAHVAILLLKLAQRQPNRELRGPQSGPVYALFDRFQRAVKQHYMVQRSAQWYADQLTISYKHLNETCKQLTGQTAKAFIDQYVLLEAKRYLCTTTLSVKEVAHHCGFEESTNFSKFFRKQTGHTANNFRQQMRR